MRAADVGLTFITVVAAGLLLESGDLHAAARSAEAHPPNPIRHSNPLLHSAARGSGDTLPAAGHHGAVALVPGRLAPQPATVAELAPVTWRPPPSLTPRAAHRPRGPPVP